MFKRYVHHEGLTSLHGSNGKYLVTVKGRIIDQDGVPVGSRKDSDGHDVVFVHGWNGEREYRVIDLMAIQYKALRIPEEDYGKVIAFVIDGNKENHHAKNIGYRFAGGKLEVKGYPGFYHIPGYTSRAINVSGELLNPSTGNILRWTVTRSIPKKNIKGGYYIAAAMFATGMLVTLSRHRALLLVFTEYPDNVDSLVSNHIDGVPGNDTLDNLELVTRGYNNTHAYDNDLKSQHMRVLVRNVRTGEVKEYRSISYCSESLGYPTDETVRQRLRTSEFGQVFQDGTQVKFKDDPRDWIIPEDPEGEIRKAQLRLTVLTRCCRSLEVKEYESISDAARALGILPGTLAFRLTHDIRSPIAGHQVKYETDTRDWPEFGQSELDKSFLPGRYKVHARNLFTGEEREFLSIRQAEKSMTRASLRHHFDKGVQPILTDGWQFKKDGEDWISIENPEEYVYRKTKDIMAREEKTGRVTIARDSSQMSKILNLDPKAIRVAALTRGNKVYHGYRFRLGVSDDSWPVVDTGHI